MSDKADIDEYNKKMGEEGEKALPCIVVIIDELANLMLDHSEEVEKAIYRLTGMDDPHSGI